MVVAVAVVRVVQVSVDQVIDMVAMRHRLVPAALAMPMLGPMGVAVMLLAAGGIHAVDGDPVFVDVVLVGMVQMAVVQVVDVVTVTDRHVAAPGAVAMRMVVVVGMSALVHGRLLDVQGRSARAAHARHHEATPQAVSQT